MDEMLMMRTSLVLLLTFGLTALLHRVSAALRHWLWVLAFGLVLILPLLALSGPLISVPVAERDLAPLPELPSANVIEQVQPSVVAEPQPQSPSVADEVVDKNPQKLVQTAHAPVHQPLNTAAVLQMLWLAGMIAVMAYGLIGHLRLMWIVRRGLSLTDPLVEPIRAQLGIRRPVRLIETSEVGVPAVWGHVILLPPNDWTAERRLVLTHEMIHIARRDTLTNGIGLTACALYWFNPLVWLGFRRMSLLAEQSCDDAVLRLGASETDYAESLLTVARQAAPGLVALARPSDLSVRVRRVLAPQASRQPVSHRWVLLLAAALTLLPLGGVNLSVVRAQETTITVAVPDSVRPLFEDQIIPAFHRENPDVRVRLVPANFIMRNAPGNVLGHDGYLDDRMALVQAADVVMVNNEDITPAAVRSGLYLDLAPLVSADPAVDPADFSPAVWETFAWDGGVWALPSYASPVTLHYDPAAFDTAGLNYPSPSWTLDDLLRAAEALTGETRGLLVTPVDLPLFVRAFSGIGFVDLVRGEAQFADSAPVIERLAAAVQNDTVALRPETGYAITDYPMLLGRSHFGGESVLLNGIMGVDVTGFAVSAGTTQADAAYTFVKFMSSWSEPIQQETVPARDSSLSEAVTLRYGSYLRAAMDRIVSGEPAIDVLQEIAFAVNTAELPTLVVTVAEPPPDTPPEDGVAIDFGLFTGVSQLENRRQWEDAIADFVAVDEAVGAVNLMFVPATEIGPIDIIVEDADCGFSPSSGYVQYIPDWIIPLDPLLAADPTFDSDDVVGGVLDQMRSGDQIWWLPVSVNAHVLYYNPAHFDAAGVPYPTDDWTVTAFLDTLRQLDTGDQPPMARYTSNVAFLEMLMIALGGEPFADGTVNFTDPAVVDAARVVLDAAKSGLIAYHEMATPTGAVQPAAMPPTLFTGQMTDYASTSPLYTGGEDYRMVHYPVGERAVPATYTVSAGFITARGEYPEECYRWLRHLTHYPELYQGMPAYHSIIEDPVTTAARGPDAVATYRQYAERLASPDLVTVSYSYAMGGYQGTLWLRRAFDRYVFEDADLEAELAEAEQFTREFIGCVDDVWYRWGECIETVDPTMWTIFER